MFRVNFYRSQNAVVGDKCGNRWQIQKNGDFLDENLALRRNDLCQKPSESWEYRSVPTFGWW